MQSEFYIYVNGKQMGPYPMGDVVKMMEARQVDPSDYIYVEEKADWIFLMDYEPLKNQGVPVGSKKANSKREDDSERIEATDPHEWYILKGENRTGPFAFIDLVKMLQEKSLYEYEYVWRPGMDSWQRVAEVADFKPDKIRDLKRSKDTSLTEVFFRRRHARAQFGGSIVVHDNKRVWKGHGFEISSGGAGIVMEHSLLVPGQVLYLHFKPADVVPPFNAVVEVVSKRFLKGVKHKDQTIHYGVKFTSIGEKALGHLNDYTQKGKAAA